MKIPSPHAGFMSMLQKRWLALNSEGLANGTFPFLSASHRSIDAILRRTISAHARGSVLDAGAGALSWRTALRKAVSRYTSIDKQKAHAELDVQGDLVATPFGAGEFDTVFCSQVLEHTPEPSRILAELARILKPGGTLILSVPHMAYLHGEPEDYYRFTRHGLAYLLESSGFTVSSTEASGGLLAFTLTIPSVFFLSLVPRLPLVWDAAFILNKAFVVLACALDRVIDTTGYYPFDYVVVARRNQ